MYSWLAKAFFPSIFKQRRSLLAGAARAVGPGPSPACEGGEGRSTERRIRTIGSRFPCGKRVAFRRSVCGVFSKTGRAFREALPKLFCFGDTRVNPVSRASPSAVLPAGERSLAGRCPVSSRRAAANRARRRRPFSTPVTPHERALDENGAHNLRAPGRAGISFSAKSPKGLRAKKKVRGGESAYPRTAGRISRSSRRRPRPKPDR